MPGPPRPAEGAHRSVPGAFELVENAGVRPRARERVPDSCGFLGHRGSGPSRSNILRFNRSDVQTIDGVETAPSSSRPERRIYLAAAFLVVLIGSVIRGHALGRFSLGNDEIHEVRWSHLPWPRMLAAAKREGVHPPLDYFAQTLLDRTGAPEWARRLPSVLAGVATIGLTIFLAGRWFGPIAGIAGGLLLALSPIHVRYSQEVRPYALGLMFLMGSLAALEAFRQKPRTVHGVAWFLSVLAAAYTLYFAGLIAALAGIAFLWTFRRTSLRPLWKALPLAVLGWTLLYLPWLPVIFSAARSAPPGVAPERLDRAWAASRLQAFGTGDWKVEPVSIGSWAFWLLVVAGVLGARRSRFAAVAAFWLLGGAAIQLAILQLRPHYPAARYLLPSWMAAVLLAAAGVALARARRTTWPWLAALVAVALVLAFDVRTSAFLLLGGPAAMERGRGISPRAREARARASSRRTPGRFATSATTGTKPGRRRRTSPLEHSRTESPGPPGSCWRSARRARGASGARRAAARRGVSADEPLRDPIRARRTDDSRRGALSGGLERLRGIASRKCNSQIVDEDMILLSGNQSSALIARCPLAVAARSPSSFRSNPPLDVSRPFHTSTSLPDVGK